jgi:hypothetical protein
MTELRKRKRSSTDLAKDAAMGAALDRLGALFAIAICLKYWKVTLIVVGVVLTVLTTGF